MVQTLHRIRSYTSGNVFRLISGDVFSAAPHETTGEPGMSSQCKRSWDRVGVRRVSE